MLLSSMGIDPSLLGSEAIQLRAQVPFMLGWDKGALVASMSVVYMV